MKSKFKRVLIVFMTCLLAFTTCIQAANLTNSETQSSVQETIDELLLLQNQIFTFAPKVIFTEGRDKASNQRELEVFRNSLNAITENLRMQLDSVQTDDITSRNMLLLLSAVDFMQSAVIELGIINTQDALVDRMLSLERYFNSRISAINTTQLVQRFINES